MPARILPFNTFTLDNGLRVIVHEHAAAPLVSVNLWYHVGSKDEQPGRTGFAHLFEHLMFEGSRNVPHGQFDELLENAGAVNNGSTNPDRTNYWETLPSGALELALFLEADRMGGLLDAITTRELEAQRDVVMNERRQSYENRPYGLAGETLLAALYPPSHPYHWPTIGSMADIAAATLADVQTFFRTYYTPGNAALAVAGDVCTKDVERLVQRWFGDIPAGSAPPRNAVPDATLAASRALMLEDEVKIPRLYLMWHSPAILANDDAALDMAARIIGDGKASRLYRTLVYEQQIAQSVSCYQISALLGSAFRIAVTARPGVHLDQIAKVVFAELEHVAREGVTQRELDRARNTFETGFIDALQNVGGFGGRADQLNHYLFYANDPGYAEADLQRYIDLRTDDIRDAVRRQLFAPHIALSVVPRGDEKLALTET